MARAAAKSKQAGREAAVARWDERRDVDEAPGMSGAFGTSRRRGMSGAMGTGGALG
jgi:hypothetical protein